MKHRLGVEVRGIVQGVGFRPYVYRLARTHGLTGNIRNSEAGVMIEVQGGRGSLSRFLDALGREAPPLAQLHEVRDFELDPLEEVAFVILESTREGEANTLISPDIATCADCVRELLDPADRRFGYPFINCTNCGPRFTITHAVPYDRGMTSMAGFVMCVMCQREYDDPLNRRFHAQPNACWNCGPQIDLQDRQGLSLAGDPIENAIVALLQGLIVAVKGLGGFHLAVDAANSAAVAELRRRKHRGEKPLAVMVADVEVARRHCKVSAAARKMLESPQRPIVLLPKASNEYYALAPDGNELGIFLPYTPLHHLLLKNFALPALVMTSGNLSDEPIAIDNQEALRRLVRIADLFLVHNRDILLRCDDSVIRPMADTAHFFRRSRGFVPLPVRLGRKVAPILATGGELKNAICISRGDYAFPGQHIGDLEELSAYEFFEESIDHFQKILGVTPRVIAHDLHPGYISTQWARRRAAAEPGVRLVGVQHHHAHIASCMAEHRLDGQVIGIALDGSGYGTDGAIWGGEVLTANRSDFTRVAHIAYVAMPGGEAAIHEPWRMAVSYLRHAFGPEWREQIPQSVIATMPAGKLKLVERILDTETGSPLTSSCGRLFDAVAALVCGRMVASYEAQAAIVLEAFCDHADDTTEYPFGISETEGLIRIETAPLFVALAADLREGVGPAVMSRQFHNGLASALASVAARIAESSGLDRVCMSGGVFQNAVLSSELDKRLVSSGLKVFSQLKLPPGDGGLSLGQLAVAAARME